jgi:Xaa-Pro aminopeptidase
MMTRRMHLARSMPARVDGFLVTGLVNVRYLCGFTGSSGALLVRPDGSATLATDGRYAEQAAQEAPDVEVTVTRRPAAELVGLARRAGKSRIAFERQRVTLASYDALRDAAGDQVDFVDGDQAVEALRTVKDEAEIASLRQACQVTDDTFAAVLAELRPGLTERQVAWRLREEMHERGAEPAFDSIVAFGPNSARPHHQPTERALAAGEFVKMDFGARVDGYHADMTRTVCVGAAADWQRELHESVRTIQRDCRDEVRPGAVPVDLDTAARTRIESAGYDVAHGLGHGVGLEIHESPFLVPDSPAARLVDRVAVTVEPGIYLPGRGGVRIEDTVLVSADGAEALTTSPRELIEI